VTRKGDNAQTATEEGGSAHSFMDRFLPLQERHAFKLRGDNDGVKLGTATVVFAGYFAMSDGAEGGSVQSALYRGDYVV
jgi:hypothetical protein